MRRAELTLRYQPVALPDPGAAPVELWVVQACEKRPPAGAEPVVWYLLTTLPVTTPAAAAQFLRQYARRWRIQLMVRLGRDVPELPAELRMLATFARSRRMAPPTCLGEAVSADGSDAPATRPVRSSCGTD